MKKGIVVLIFILLLSVIVSNTNNNKLYAAKGQGKYTIYVVRENDCLSVIAERYKPKYKKLNNFMTEIKLVNGLVGDDITAGKTLIIPRNE